MTSFLCYPSVFLIFSFSFFLPLQQVFGSHWLDTGLTTVKLIMLQQWFQKFLWVFCDLFPHSVNVSPLGSIVFQAQLLFPVKKLATNILLLSFKSTEGAHFILQRQRFMVGNRFKLTKIDKTSQWNLSELQGVGKPWLQCGIWASIMRL